MTSTGARVLLVRFLCLAPVVSLSACASEPAPPVDTSPAQTAPLLAADAVDRLYGTTGIGAGDPAEGRWLADNPVLLWITSIDAQPRLVVDGPCNAFTYELEAIDADPLTWTISGGPAMTFVGCMDEAGRREQWLRDALGADSVTLTQTTSAVQVTSGDVTIDAVACTEAGSDGEEEIASCVASDQG